VARSRTATSSVPTPPILREDQDPRKESAGSILFVNSDLLLA
jgi:hypothetical protein